MIAITNFRVVWQIAQRDYRFGKGKHSSLTPATYTAVANHFRKLWGKEAGWAHSVLFTADLKTFSDRLVAAQTELKADVKKETTIKAEPDIPEPAEMITTTRIVTRKRVKHARDQGENWVVKVEESSVKRNKRRKA
jgi:N-glycosylase/DNA lyase